MQKHLGYGFCRNESEKNLFAAGPFKRTDCSLVSDGAVAMVIVEAETAREMPRGVTFRAVAHSNDFLPD